MIPGGMNIVVNNLLTVPAEDWSRVRSRARARRRMRQGHRQNVRHYDAPSPRFMIIGNTVYCHPDALRELETVVAAPLPLSWCR